MPADCSRNTNGPALPSMIGSSGPATSTCRLSMPRPASADIRCSTVEMRRAAALERRRQPRVADVLRLRRDRDGLRQVDAMEHDAGVGARQGAASIRRARRCAARRRSCLSRRSSACAAAACVVRVPAHVGRAARQRALSRILASVGSRTPAYSGVRATSGRSRVARPAISPPACAGTPGISDASNALAPAPATACRPLRITAGWSSLS